MIEMLLAGSALLLLTAKKRSEREAAAEKRLEREASNAHMDELLREHKRILLKEMK